jgi:anti-anti-sigma factor
MSEFTAEPRVDDPHVLVVSGELDLAVVDEFLQRARVALGNAATVLEIDFGSVTFIDSTGLGALVRIREDAVAQGKDVTLSHVPAQTTRILEMTGLADVFVERPDR